MALNGRCTEHMATLPASLAEVFLASLEAGFSRVQQFGKRTRISSTPLRSHFIYFRVVLLLLLN